MPVMCLWGWDMWYPDTSIYCRDQSRCAASQWETLLHCNDVSHWLGAYLDWSLILFMFCFCYYWAICNIALYSWLNYTQAVLSWWCHPMDTFSALLAICMDNSPVPGEFPAQRPVTRSFDVFFDLRPNKQLSKQSWGWWFEMPSRP